MADDTTTTTDVPEQGETTTTADTKAEESVPYERFQKANQQAKEAKAAAQAAQKRADELQRAMEERESAGLPELEQMKRRLEQAEKAREAAEQKAQETDARLARTTKQSWVTRAAAEANFTDPSDAAAFLDLDGIEDEKDAERAVKRLAGQKKHLIKVEEKALPGRVLENGRQPAPTGPQVPGGGIADADRQWAEEVAPALQKMIGGWSSTSS
jgi:hypothetical protein